MNETPESGRQLPVAGDVVLIRDDIWLTPEWRIVRVVKVGKVMWEFEPYSPREGWAAPRKRKVEAFMHFTGDPIQAHQRLASARAHMEKVRKDAVANYSAAVVKIAGGASE